MKNCLLLGRKATIVNDVKNGIEASDINLFGGTSLENVKATFAVCKIDIVIMGIGFEIIKYIFETSNSINVI